MSKLCAMEISLTSIARHEEDHCQRPELARVILSAAEHIGKLETSLLEMLDCYWGGGDGATPPEFIQQAAKLCGYEVADIPSSDAKQSGAPHIPDEIEKLAGE